MNDSTRTSDLKRMLDDRRREVQADIRHRVQRTRRNRSNDVREDIERADASTQGDIELALVQMRAETVVRIDDALRRLDAGKYGSCIECAHEITERRLRALPFAVRCQACEERREREHGGKRALAQSGRSLSLFLDVLNP
ncbi:MAG TPA: TraR/DksA C4-type zinc finger protein [Vicinamibacterales bacterium]